MNNLNLIQKNELIARYMEIEMDEDKFLAFEWDRIYLYNGEWKPARKLKFHLSWDWLMPVIEKISKTPLLESDGTPCKDPQDVCYPLTFGMPTADGKQVMFRFKGSICHEAETLIQAAFDASVDFIEFENLQKQENKK